MIPEQPLPRFLVRAVSRKEGEAGPDLMFFCPGCKCGHGVRVKKDNPQGAPWSWNGDFERPTFEPSVLVTGSRFTSATDDTPVQMRCHSYVRDGHIQFLSDCDHKLAGKTVALLPF